MSKENIYVTRPYLPPLEEFIPYLEEIWENKILTNGGPMHQQFEKALADYLGVSEVVLFNNGMNALLTALQVLDIKGEVITTPYSFVATTQSIIWSQAIPVFVDIDPNTLNLDPSKVEAAITEKTQAIMPVHCYGNPCDTQIVADIAAKHNLKVIYDAAHAFAVRDTGGSILRHGDLSVLSFHATKVFNTFEGGAVICHSSEMKQKITQLKNFGMVDETTICTTGLNGKMSEINAAFGLVQLRHIDYVMKIREKIDQAYRKGLANIKGIKVVNSTGQTQHNFAYFPILVTQDYPLSRDDLYQKLKDHHIYARRYFYPLISEFEIYKNLPSARKALLPVANEIAEQIICLPIYPDLAFEVINNILNIIKVD